MGEAELLVDADTEVVTLFAHDVCGALANSLLDLIRRFLQGCKGGFFVVVFELA